MIRSFGNTCSYNRFLCLEFGVESISQHNTDHGLAIATMNSLFKLNYRRFCYRYPFAAFSSHQKRFLWTSHQLHKSHYATLELAFGATQSDIKSAYYKLSMKFHPDKNKGNEEKFKDINTAYEVLGNPRLRRLYDRGIISDDQSPTIYEHTVHDDSGPVVDQSENAKASVRSFDQWSRNHYSETFVRSQTEKHNRMKSNSMKKVTSAGSENIIWIIGLICMGLTFISITFGWDKSKKKS